MELLVIDKINTGYHKKPVLFDISMTVEHGEIVSIIGPNGAGKSTILKAVSGLLPLWNGDILFEGESIKKNTPAKNIKMGLTFKLGRVAFAGMPGELQDNRQKMKELFL